MVIDLNELPGGAHPPTPAGTGETLLAVRGLTKVFGPLRANDGVEFSVRAGEVHALLGENGDCWCTTLMHHLPTLYSLSRQEGVGSSEGSPLPQQHIRS